MKNIFEYATKELSQDAFLAWLFESWEDESVSETAFGLLELFGVKVKKEDIKSIKCFLQIKKIDVSVYIETKRAEQDNYLLFIEDKVDSDEHEQLKNYDEMIFGKKKETKNLDYSYPVIDALINRGCDGLVIPKEYDKPITGLVIKRIFYKTANIREKERKRVLKTNYSEAPLSMRLLANEKWLIFEMDEILKFFEENKTENILINHYTEHLKMKKEKLNNTELPTGRATDDNILWIAYLENSLEKELKSKGYLTNVYCWGGGDIGLQVKLKNKNADEFDNADIPYVNVRKRKFNDNGTVDISVEIYGMENKDEKENKNKWYKDNKDKIIRFINEINKLNYENNSKYPIEGDEVSSKGLDQGNKKTIAHYKKASCKTNEELIKAILKCLNQLEKIDREYYFALGK